MVTDQGDPNYHKRISSRVLKDSGCSSKLTYETGESTNQLDLKLEHLFFFGYGAWKIIQWILT